MRYSDDTNEERETPEIPHSLEEIMTAGLDMKLHLVQHHARMAYVLAGELLSEETTFLTGQRRERHKPLDGQYRRWGSNPGSIRIDGERIPIRVPRVRNVVAGCERPLESYQHLKSGIDIDEHLE